MAPAVNDKKLAVLAQLSTLQTQAAALSHSSSDEDVAAIGAAIHDASSQLTAMTVPPLAAALRTITEPVRSMALRVAIECGWLEALAAATPKELNADELAKRSEAAMPLVVRLMRVLCAERIVDEVGPATYRGNGVTAVFCVSGIRDGAKVWFDTWAPMFLNTPRHLAHFSYREPTDFATCPFVFTNKMSVWKFFEQHPSKRADFDSYMTAHRAGRQRWVESYPVEERLLGPLLTEDDETNRALVVDVGGGWGHDLIDFRNSGKTPAVDGSRLVLQDLAEGLPPAGSDMEKQLEEMGVKIMPHDFFTPQPVKGARIYSFRSVLHDWPDEECRRILENTVPAMERGRSKILINDIVIPDQGATPLQVWLDMLVMAGAGAKERSQQDWYELLDSVGLRITEVFPMGEESIIEVDLK